MGSMCHEFWSVSGCVHALESQCSTTCCLLCRLACICRQSLGCSKGILSSHQLPCFARARGSAHRGHRFEAPSLEHLALAFQRLQREIGCAQPPKRASEVVQCGVENDETNRDQITFSCWSSLLIQQPRSCSPFWHTHAEWSLFRPSKICEAAKSSLHHLRPKLCW